MQFSLPRFSTGSLVGLDIGSSSVKAVELAARGRGKDFELRSLGLVPLPSEAIVQGAFLNSSASTSFRSSSAAAASLFFTCC